MTLNLGPEVTVREFYVILQPLQKKIKFMSGSGAHPTVDKTGRRVGGGVFIKKEPIGASGAPGSILIDLERSESTF